MLYSLLITLREGLEAALIIGIVLAYLKHIGRPDQARPIWVGTAAALLATLATGLAVAATAAQLSGKALEIFEGSAMFLAAGVLTYMVVWMHRQAGSLTAHLKSQVDAAMGRGSPLALATLAFIVIIREGVETVLFLQAGAASTLSPPAYWTGAEVGIALAVLLGVLLYGGAVRLPLRTFFNLTGTMLIFFAAGMLANGVKEFQEAGVLLPIVPHVWDTYTLLADNSTIGRFMGAFLGYDASPSLMQILAFFGYLALGLALYYRALPPSSSTKPQRPTLV